MKPSKSGNLPNNLHDLVQTRAPMDYPWRVLQSLVADHRHSLDEKEHATLASIIRSRSYDRYVALGEEWGPQSIPPESLPLEKFRVRYQVTSLLKKFQFPGNASQRRQAAKEKFLSAEDQCERTNSLVLSNDFHSQFCSDPVVALIFDHTKSFLRQLLGTSIPERNKLTEWSRHGPGANMDTKNGQTSMYNKYADVPYSCSTRATGHARLAIADDQRWMNALMIRYCTEMEIPCCLDIDWESFWSWAITTVDYNRITFVPKNAKTDRSIAIEPSLNLYLQLGVDGYIRRRLKRWGVDLDDQSKNQRLAELGSVLWTEADPYVTLDLAAASDTVSVGVCHALLPVQWFSYLCDIRSPFGVLDDEIIVYEKISSMGNGFTFALESAIFAAIVYACNKVLRGNVKHDDYAIFGDDIVCLRSVSNRVKQMLNLCGFSINLDKSHESGPFRESCGADYLAGNPVRPVFLTEQPTTVFGLWCDMNRLRRHLSLYRGLEWDTQTCDLIRQWIPPRLRGFQGPCSNETFDTYEHVPRPTTRQRNSLWRYRALRVTLRERRVSDLLFRKLMHPLRPGKMDTVSTATTNLRMYIAGTGLSLSPWSSKSWGGGKLSAGKGGVFTVTRANCVDVSVSLRYTSVWCSSYN